MANVSTKLVYVSNELHKKLKIIAAQRGVAVGKLVEIAIEKLESDK